MTKKPTQQRQKECGSVVHAQTNASVCAKSRGHRKATGATTPNASSSGSPIWTSRRKGLPKKEFYVADVDGRVVGWSSIIPKAERQASGFEKMNACYVRDGEHRRRPQPSTRARRHFACRIRRNRRRSSTDPRTPERCGRRPETCRCRRRRYPGGALASGDVGYDRGDTARARADRWSCLWRRVARRDWRGLVPPEADWTRLVRVVAPNKGSTRCL